MNKSGRIEVLDGLRVVAILMVMLFHFYSRYGYKYYNYQFDAHLLFKYGYLGVQLFFIISGFVITLTLSKCHGFLDFMKRRFVRLIPGMLVCSISTFLLISFFDSGNLFPESKSIHNLLVSNTFISPGYIRTFFGVRLTYTDGVYWSLGTELQFYILGSILYFLSKRNFLRNYAVFGIVTSILFFVSSSGIGHEYISNKLGESNYRLINYTNRAFPLFEYNLWFLAGIVINKLYYKKHNTILLLFLFFVFGLQMFFLNELYPILFTCIVLLIFLMFLYYPKGLSLLANNALRKIGVASYSIYLIHQNIGVLAINKLSVYFGVWNWVLPIIVIVSFLYFGVISYNYIEVNLSKRLKAILEKKYPKVEPSIQ